MEKSRTATLSLALIVLICFFLPWVQISCGGAHDTSSGLDLARSGDRGLWLIPVLMVMIILFAVRILPIQQVLFGLVSLLSGLISAYLMNHERLKFKDGSSLITAQLTGWFWLGFFAAIGVVVFGVAGILQRPRSP
jgi:hypothetical protein